MKVRPTAVADRPAVLEVVGVAFGGEVEVHLVERIWDSPEHIPDLDLVADDDGVIAGHVILSRGSLAGAGALGLGPLAVAPDRQRKGVGGLLMEHALRVADAAGHTIVVLLGHPTYYPRFGFVRASTLGIQPPFELGDDAAFMARPLSAWDASSKGQFHYAPAFESM